MVTDSLRREIWHNLFEASRLTRFYLALKSRSVWRRDALRLLLGVAGAVTALPLAFESALAVMPYAGASVVVFLIIERVLNYDDKVLAFGRIAAELDGMLLEYRLLWEEIENGSASQKLAVNTMNRLKARISELTHGKDFGGYERLDQTCAIDAYTVEKERYVIG